MSLGLTVNTGSASKRLYGTPPFQALPISWKLTRHFPDRLSFGHHISDALVFASDPFARPR